MTESYNGKKTNKAKTTIKPIAKNAHKQLHQLITTEMLE